MNNDDSGPAFPVQDLSKWQCHGLTVRDYFAAKAMQSLLANLSETDRRHLQKQDNPAAKIAEAAYVQADAMLKARQQQD